MSISPGVPRRKHLSDDALLVHIKASHAQSKAEYGWPMVWKELLIRGIPVGKERVRRLMQLHGIKARSKRKYKATTNSNHSLPERQSYRSIDTTLQLGVMKWSG